MLKKRNDDTIQTIPEIKGYIHLKPTFFNPNTKPIAKYTANIDQDTILKTSRLYPISISGFMAKKRAHGTIKVTTYKAAVITLDNFTSSHL